MRVLDHHAAGLAFNSADAPRGVAQQDDVVAIAFHGEVFIERADNGAFGLRNHGV